MAKPVIEYVAVRQDDDGRAVLIRHTITRGRYMYTVQVFIGADNALDLSEPSAIQYSEILALRLPSADIADAAINTYQRILDRKWPDKFHIKKARSVPR